MAKYYKPQIVTTKDVDIDNAGYSGELPSGADNGLIKVGVEEDVVIQRLSKDLYASPASGIRELYVNEARACRTAQKLGFKPEIHLSVDTDSRSIILEGKDSMGMSWDTFSNVFCVLGRSTNFDGTESGQFGFGRAAYMCISETMILETHCRETGEKYGVMGMDGTSFKTGLPTPKMEHYGTKVSMTANQDVSLDSIVKMVQECAVLSGVPTFIDTGRTEPGSNGKCVQKNISNMIRTEPGPKILNGEPVHVLVGNDVEVAFVGENTPVRYNEKEAFLCGVPISYTYNGVFGFLDSIVINAKDERKYQPTPDRERLSEKGADELTKRVDQLVLEYIDSFGPMTFQEYVERKDMRLFHTLNSHKRELPDAVRAKVALYEDYEMILGAAGIAYPEERVSIGYYMEDLDFLVAETFDEKAVNAVRKSGFEGPIVKPVNSKEMVDLMAKHGIKTVKKYMRDNKIKKSKKPLPTKVVVHSTECPGTTLTYLSNSLPEGLVLLKNDKEFDIFHNSLINGTWRHKSKYNWETPVCYAKARKSGSVKGTSLEEWHAKLANHILETTDGVLTVGQIASSGKPILEINSYLQTHLKVSNDCLGIYWQKAPWAQLLYYLDVKGIESRRFKVSDLASKDKKDVIACGFGKNDDYGIEMLETIVLYRSIKTPLARKMFRKCSGSRNNGISAADFEQVSMVDKTICANIKPKEYSAWSHKEGANKTSIIENSGIHNQNEVI